GVDHHLGVLRFFVRIRNASELFQDTGARFGVQAFPVTLLADLQRSGDMYEDESAIRLDHPAHLLADRVIRRNGRADRDTAIFADFRSDVADVADINVAVLLGEAQFGGKMLANQVTVEQGHRPSSQLEKLGAKRVRNRGLARSRKPREENGHALLVPRWIATPQLLDDLRIGEPGGNIAALIQTPAKFRAGNVQHARPVLYFVVWDVAVLVLQVDHHAERHHGHADVGLVFLEQLLRF